MSGGLRRALAPCPPVAQLLGCKGGQLVDTSFSSGSTRRFGPAVVHECPKISAHVAPRPERPIGFGLAADSQDVAVEIFDLHLVSPRKIRWRLSDSSTRGEVLAVDRVDVVNADPNPRSRISLIALDQEQRAPPARDRCNALVEIQFEPERVEIVVDALR